MTLPGPIPVNPPPKRLTTSVLPVPESLPSYVLTAQQRSYEHQYSAVYYMRLTLLKKYVEAAAHARWRHVDGDPVLVPNVLEVIKSKICYVVGTVYMDMPLKPNVMEEIARDHSIPAPIPPDKYLSEEDNVMLEDESGRLKLVGQKVKEAQLVTGIVIGVLGLETSDGDFEVIDICCPGMAPMIDDDIRSRGSQDGGAMDIDVDGGIDDDAWIAMISGLNIGDASSSDLKLQMLTEYLTGELDGVLNYIPVHKISRLIIAGNSFANMQTIKKAEVIVASNEKKARRYGYDASSFSPLPTSTLSACLLDIGRSIPIHILPGEHDPSGAILPQQPFPRAMFGDVASYQSFCCESNPVYLRICPGYQPQQKEATAMQKSPFSRTILVHSGQPLNDMFKYLATPPHTNLSLMESTLKWRHMAPTAPDTLWCHPYREEDPFVMRVTPDIYVAGGQQEFGTKMVQDEADSSRRCRIVMLPSFAQSGLLVLVNLRSLEVKCISFATTGFEK